MINIPMNTKPPVSLGAMAQAQNSGGAAPQQAPVQQPAYNAPQQPVQQPVYNTPQQPVQQPVYNAPQQPVQQPVYNAPSQPVQQQPVVRPNQGGGVVLKKGQKTSLAKFGNALENVDVGLGWDVAGQGTYDLDAECFILGDNDKVLGDDWFVYYNQVVSPDGAIRHSGDNGTGAGAGDDEVISIRLSQVNPQVKKLVFVVTINEAKERGLNFSGVSNAYIRLLDRDANRELCRFNLTDYYSNVTSMVVAELYRHNGEWKMNPVGDGIAADLFDLCMRYGVNVSG